MEEVHRLRVSERLLFFILVSLPIRLFFRGEASFGVDLTALLFQSIKMSHEAFARSEGCGGGRRSRAGWGWGRGDSWGRRMLENDASVHSRLILSSIKRLGLSFREQYLFRLRLCGVTQRRTFSLFDCLRSALSPLALSKWLSQFLNPIRTERHGTNKAQLPYV